MNPFNLFESFANWGGGNHFGNLEIIQYEDFYDQLLPNIKMEILRYLDAPSLKALSESCKKWNQFIRVDFFPSFMAPYMIHDS